jgi:integrase/recombinase XerC
MKYLEEFLNFLKFEKQYSFHTYQAYLIDLNQFAEFCQNNYHISEPEEINHKLIRKWIVSLIEENITARSINRKLSALKSFYRFLLKKGLLDHNPLDKVVAPKIKKRLPVFVEEKHMNNLLDDIDFGNDFLGVRNKLIIEMFYYTGIRLSELINLKDLDVDIQGLTIKVLGKRKKERIIPIINGFALEINNYRKIRSNDIGIQSCEYFFINKKGEKLYPEYVYRTIRKFLQLVTTIDKKSPHILRHTFATHLLNKGADLNAIKELLGHANLSATEVYTHNSFEKLTRIYKQAHPRS